MSSCRSRPTDIWRAVARTLAILLLWMGAGAARASWFGQPCPGPGLIAVEDHEVFLHVRRNEADDGSDESLRVLRDGRLLARPEILSDWGVSAPQEKAQADGEGGYWQALDNVAGLEYRYDSCTQELLVDLSHTERARKLVEASSRTHPQPQLADTPGGYINVDAQAATGSLPSWNALTEIGGFAGAGHGVAQMLIQEGRALRLDTNWTLDDPAALRQWVVGDAISREAPGRRPARFGGLSWGTEFRLQPDVVTFPLPALRGDAVLPSSVDVYVNGMLRQHDEVPEGPFELRGVPVTSGGGEMHVVVRDLLGREQTLAQPFYVSPSLLREGLSDYRFDAGWLRQRYGLSSSAYGPAFGALAYRIGFSDRYTGSFGADLGRGHQGAGLGLTTQLGLAGIEFGTGNLELGGSHAARGSGAQAQFGLQHNGAAFSASLDLRAATPDYESLGDSQRAARYASSLHAGLPLGSSGDSLSATVIAEKRRDEPALRLYSLNYSMRLGADWLLGAQATRIRSATDDWVLGLGLTWLLGSGSTGGYVQHSAAANLVRASWQQQPAQTMGLGYQLDAEHGLGDRAIGQARWAQERGVMTAGAELGEHGSAFRYGLQTGLALLGGSLFPTRPVQGSFAVVEAGGVEGVRIYRDHQLVSRTGPDGLALVPDLRPYEPNQIGIELNDLPIEQRVDVEQIVVAPYARSGVAVRFPVSAPAQQRWLRLRRDDGSWLPADARVFVLGGHGEALLGSEGRVLLQAASATAQLRAQWQDGRCRVQLQPEQAGGAELELVRCRDY